MQQDSTKITQSSPGGSFAKQDFFFFYCVNDIHQDQDIRQIEVENKSV